MAYGAPDIPACSLAESNFGSQVSSGPLQEGLGRLFLGKRKKKKMDKERAKFSKFGAGLLFETRKKNTSFALTLNMLTITLHKNNAIRRQLYLIPLCMMYITFLSTPSQLQDKNVACGQFNASNRIQIFRSLVRKFGPLKLRLVLLVRLVTLFNLKPK